MSFSSGVFSINSTGQPVVTGTTISSTVFNAFTADIATGLSTCVLKDGTQTLTANIPMGGFKLTGLAAGTAATDTATIGGTETLSNKTIPIKDANLTVQATADVTKQAQLSLSGLTAGTTRTLTLQDQSITLGALARSYLAGLTLSTAGSSATMTIAAGQATDSTNSIMMTLASAISKTTSAWAVGTGNGGLDTGSIANATWYKFYEIIRPDTGVVDIIFTTAALATGPAMPANYTKFRYIGSGLTNGSAQWVLFVQDGDYFRWSASVLDTNANNPGTSAVTRALSVPTGLNVFALFNATLVSTVTSSRVLFSDLAATDEAPSVNALPLSQAIGNTTVDGAGAFQIRTNTTQQIRTRLTASDANTTLYVATFGWIDRRQRDA